MRPPDSWSKARATLGLILLTGGCFILATMLGLREWAVFWGGFIPARFGFDGELAAAPFALTPLTATLVHADVIHVGFNLLILGFCGLRTEGVLGRTAFLILYGVGAYVAAAAQFVADPQSTVPMIGASGAVSAVLGAYAILFGRNKVRVANSTLALWLNALWLMAAWIVLQLIVGFVAGQTQGMGLAVAAHIGGFLAGVALANPLLLFRYRNA